MTTEKQTHDALRAVLDAYHQGHLVPLDEGSEGYVMGVIDAGEAALAQALTHEQQTGLSNTNADSLTANASAQTPAELAAEIKRLVCSVRDETWKSAKGNVDVHVGDVMQAAFAVINRLAALASAQVQQEPFWFAVLSGRALGDKAIRSEEVAHEYANRRRELWPDVEVVPLYRTAPPVQQASEQCGKGCACLAQCGDVYAHAAEGDAPQPERAGVVTPAMVEAGAKAAREYMERTGGNDPAVIYRAMRAAAPERAGVVPDALKRYLNDVLFDGSATERVIAQTALHILNTAPPAPAVATDSNLVTLDKRDLFCTVRSAIKDAIQTDESYAADDWSRAHDLAVACLSPLIGEAPPAPSVEPMARFCPGCGSVGSVPAKYRDCCPDGGKARIIPESLAKDCHNLFQLAIHAAAPAVEAVPVSVPFKVETWPVDADGFEANLCTVCGTPTRYGSRHSKCGDAVEKREPLSKGRIAILYEQAGREQMENIESLPHNGGLLYEQTIECLFARAVEREHGIGIPPADAKGGL